MKIKSAVTALFFLLTGFACWGSAFSQELRPGLSCSAFVTVKYVKLNKDHEVIKGSDKGQPEDVPVFFQNPKTGESAKTLRVNNKDECADIVYKKHQNWMQDADQVRFETTDSEHTTKESATSDSNFVEITINKTMKRPYIFQKRTVWKVEESGEFKD